MIQKWNIIILWGITMWNIEWKLIKFHMWLKITCEMGPTSFKAAKSEENMPTVKR